MKGLAHIGVVPGLRTDSCISSDLQENNLVALRKKRKMHSLYFRRYSIKGPFTGLQKLLEYCAVDDGEERSSCMLDIKDV